MKLLLGVLLSFGLLLQAFDIVASVPHKNFIKTRFVETSSRLRTYSSREIALWALIGFSRKLDGWFGPNVLSRRTLQSLCLVHFILFSSFSFLLAYALSSESRRVTYGWAFSAAELSPDALDKLVAGIKQINPAFPDLHYDLFMSSMNLFKPIIAILFLFFALLTSCIFSYLSLGATRLLLRRAIAGKTVVSLVLFIFVDCTIASLLMVSFAVLSVVIVLAILQLIGVSLAWKIGSFGLTTEAVVAYFECAEWLAINMLVDIDRWSTLGSTASVGWNLFFQVHSESLIKYAIDMKHLFALEWNEISFAAAVKNWAWSLSLLPTVAYLVYMGGAQLVARAGFVQRGFAALLTWLAQRDRGPVYVIGWALLAIFAVIRFVAL